MITTLMIVAAAASTSFAAQHQLPDEEVRTGSRVPQKVDKREHEITDVRKIQYQFAQCVVAKKREAAVEYLLHYPSVEEGDPNARRLIRKIADGDCLVKASTGDFDSIQMNLPGDTMRYVLADALVRLELGTAPLNDLVQVPKLQHPQLEEADFRPKPGAKANAEKLKELAEARGKEVGRIYLSQFGECVVRADPAKSRDLLQTDPTSAAESAAFAQLTPVLGQCLDAGQSLTLNKIIVRGTVAYNHYRLAKAPRAPMVAATPAGVVQ